MVTYLSSSKQAVQYLIRKCRVDVSVSVRSLSGQDYLKENSITLSLWRENFAFDIHF